MLISRENLHRFISRAGEANYEKAREIIKNKKIKIEKFQIGMDFEFIYVYAKIENEYRDININFTIDLLNKDIEIYHCQCNYYSSKICPHTLACVLEFCADDRYEIQTLEAIQEKQREIELLKFKNFIDDFSNEFSINADSEEFEYIPEGTIKIIPELKYDGYPLGLKLGFKIGEKQFYKIKDLTKFYSAFINKEMLYYGAKLSFVHTEEAFSNRAKPFLQLILKYAETIDYANNIIKNTRYYYSTRNISKADIELTGSVADDFFDIFNEEEYLIEYNKEKSGFKLINKKPYIKFKIKKEDNDTYLLTANFSKLLIIKGIKYVYFIKDNYIYKLDRFKNVDLIKMVELYNKSDVNEYRFNKRYLLEFINKILPRVKDIVDIGEMPEDEIIKLIPKKLSVKVLLDVDTENNIILNLKFCYGDIEFNPLNKKEIPSIPRDFYKEDEVFRRIKQDGFYHFAEDDNIFVLNDEERIYEFLSNSIKEYMEKFEVLVTEQFKKNEIKQPKISCVGVKIQNDLLNIDLSGFDFDKEELYEIINKYRQRKKYYRLKNGTFLNLETTADMEFLDNVTEDITNSIKQIPDGKINIPINRSLYLNSLLNKLNNVQINQDKYFEKIVNDNIKIENIEIPNEQKSILRPYQKTGYRWLKTLDRYKFGGILADDMGLGKTIQVITILQSNKSNSIHKPSFVICPSSLTLNWKNEVEKFGKGINCIIITGNAIQREEQIKKCNVYDLVITSYDLLRRDIDIYNENEIKFRYQIADEAQYIKNSNTLNAKSLKKINAEIKFALTGTPIENSLAELWSIFDYIMPGYLFNYNRFKRDYETKIIKENDEKTMNKLRTMIEPFILRRTKKEVLAELPEKTITVIKNEMNEEQRKIYVTFLAQTKKEVARIVGLNDIKKSKIQILALLTRLRQICCHPSLFLDSYDGESSKLIQCIELIKEAISGNHKILLFSSYTEMFNIIERELEKEGINYFKLTGETKVDKRIEMVDEFNSDENIKVFLISLKAGGTGLNLTGADIVIHYDPWWNLSVENQATDRAYRIGQKNNVQVYKLITKNSIEEKINDLQQKKSNLIENVLDTQTTFINQLTEQEILNLFK